MIILAAEIPAACAAACEVTGEPWQHHPWGVSLRAIPRLHHRLTALGMPAAARDLETGVPPLDADGETRARPPHPEPRFQSPSGARITRDVKAVASGTAAAQDHGLRLGLGDVVTLPGWPGGRRSHPATAPRNRVAYRLVAPPHRARTSERDRLHAVSCTPSPTRPARSTNSIRRSLAELFPAGLVLLDGAVGEKQHPVAAPQDLLADLRRGPAETDRQGGQGSPAAGQPGGRGSAAAAGDRH